MEKIKWPILQLTVVLLVFVFSCNQQEKKENAEPASTGREQTAPAPKTPDKTLLVGDWVRTDAPYQINIAELPEGGNMKAAYFNPRSINVAKSTWSIDGGRLRIYIELRDENYPGSNYNLVYIDEQDMLTGKYFQAVEGITYDVGFVRKK